jgi:DNA segregation ATPase FtsK/SpoIIIE, S-DNA-T family
VTLRGRSVSPAVLGVSVVFLSLSGAALLALVVALAGAGGAAAAPGRFLLDSFSWASFFIPAYFVLATLLLTARVFRVRLAVMLTLSVVPFLTLALLLDLLAGSPLVLPQLLLSAFGATPAAVLLFLLFLLEVLFLATLPFGMTTALQGGKAALSRGREPLQLPPPEDEGEAVSAALRGVEVTQVPVQVTLGEPAGDSAEDGPGELAPAAGVIDEVIAAEETLPADEALLPEEPGVVGEPGAPPEALLPEEPEGQTEAAGTSPAAPAAPPGGPQPELPFEPGSGGKAAYSVPVEGVLKQRGGEEYWLIDDETRRASRILTDALQEFNIQAEVTGIRKGPVITLFEVLPAPGVRISKIANLSDNIALRLAAPSVRIVAPIPGKHAVGIEVPNRKRAIVSFKEMIALETVQKPGYEIPVALGKDILGEAQIIDLVQTPHLLIGGATNSGKSVLVNAIICSILFRKSPDEVRLFLIDPKIVELKSYNGVPHLLTPVITDPRKAFQALTYCISEMERRYTLLDALAVRDIRSFNRKARKERVQKLPYIVVVIDEFADLMATTGKELESTLARLAAMARAVGIHMVLATQRPSIDVITGLIKANIPSRIAFMVANKFDSRIIIDAVGAEKLLGKGDMLFSAAWNPFPMRIQGAYVDDEETDSITEYVKKLGPPQYIDDEVFFEDDDEGGDFQGEPGNDPLFERALEIVVSQGKASASYLQRRLKVGYNRAARLVEEMEMRGIVGPAQGSKPREIIHVPKPGRD